MKRDNVRTDKIENEIKDIISFPEDEFIRIIQEVGFECDRCGKCCTSVFNDHVFLLDEDAKKIIEHAGKDLLRPAPDYDFCDNLGRFYVMGYALKNRPSGDCIFYNGSGCEHYEIRPAICRIYPYMLHREADDKGYVEFRQIGGLNLHGLYHNEIDAKTCNEIINDVKKFESKFLLQKLEFLNKINKHFKKYALKHSRQIYDRGMRDLKSGKEIEIYVFFQGRFEKEIFQSHSES